MWSKVCMYKCVPFFIYKWYWIETHERNDHAKEFLLFSDFWCCFPMTIFSSSFFLKKRETTQKNVPSLYKNMRKLLHGEFEERTQQSIVYSIHLGFFIPLILKNISDSMLFFFILACALLYTYEFVSLSMYTDRHMNTNNNKAEKNEDKKVEKVQQLKYNR